MLPCQPGSSRLATLRAPAKPVELTLEVVPRARLDVIDVRDEAAAIHGSVLDRYSHCLYCSHHTTAGYFQQNLAARLSGRTQGVGSYIDLFRTIFPEGAGYRHDELDAADRLRPISGRSSRPTATRTRLHGGRARRLRLVRRTRAGPPST